MNNVVKRAKEHVWYSHDAPLVQELLDEIEKSHLDYSLLSDDYKQLLGDMEKLRSELATWRRAADEGHPQPCTLGPNCPYCEIEKLRIKIVTMGNSTKLMYDEMANSREALKAQRDTYKQRLEDALEVLRSVAASRDEAILILENATAVAKQATAEVLQLRERVSALEFKLKSLYTVVQAEAPEILLVHDILNYNIRKLLNDH